MGCVEGDAAFVFTDPKGVKQYVCERHAWDLFEGQERVSGRITVYARYAHVRLKQKMLPHESSKDSRAAFLFEESRKRRMHLDDLLEFSWLTRGVNNSFAFH